MEAKQVAVCQEDPFSVNRILRVEFCEESIAIDFKTNFSDMESGNKMAAKAATLKGEDYRLPGDLLYSLWSPPLLDNEDNDNAANNNSQEQELCISSTVPATINIPIDSSIESLVVYYKSGFDQSSAKGVPLTCLASGITRTVPLNSYKNVLADRYINTGAWVKHGTKVGQIKAIKATYDFQIRHSKVVIQNVAETDIEAFPVFYPGQFVSLRGWIGTVKLIRRKLHLQYHKGYECYLYEKDYEEDEDDSLCPRPNFDYLYQSDTVCPSSRDVQHAEWTCRPGWLDWFSLRWFNWGSSVSVRAQVISNEIDYVMVDWYIPRNLSNIQTDVAPPFSKISGNELDSVVKLDMKPLWYGVKGKYTVKTSDSLLTIEEWESNLSHEFGYPIVNRAPYLRKEHAIPTVTDEKAHQQLKFESGTEVTGKIVARRASATVAWADSEGEISDVSLKELIPCYSEVDTKHPFVVGDVVLRSDYASSLKLLYGIVQSRQPGLCFVKWFGGEPNCELPYFVKEWGSTEAVENLYLCNEFKFPVGVIVFTRRENTPGVVIGNSLSGHVTVRMDDVVKKLHAYELIKFDQISYSFNSGNEFRWSKLQDKYFLNHKHLSLCNVSNIFNITPAVSVLHAIPQAKYFEILKNAPQDHYFFLDDFYCAESHPQPADDSLAGVWKNEVALLETNSTAGIWIKAFEDRMDLLSVMMTGQPGSLFEAALFCFDIFLPPGYPEVAPIVRLIPNSGFDTRSMTRHQLNLMELDGTLKLDKILTKRDEKNFSGLWLMLAGIQYELFGVSQFMEHQGGKFKAITKMAFTSYSGQIEDAIRIQKIFRRVTNTILSWLIDPPESSMWLNDALKYWKLELPLFISRTKQLMRLCQEEQYTQGNAQATAGKYHFVVSAMLPPDTILLSELDSALRDLAIAYCKLY